MTSNLSHCNKSSNRCSDYRQAPLRTFEKQVYIGRNHPATIQFVYQNAHYRKKKRNTRLVQHRLFVNSCLTKREMASDIFAITEDWKDLESCAFDHYVGKSVPHIEYSEKVPVRD